MNVYDRSNRRLVRKAHKQFALKFFICFHSDKRLRARYKVSARRGALDMATRPQAGTCGPFLF